MFFAQSNIKIAVTGPDNLALVRAIVMVSQGENQIAFGTTNDQGVFDKNMPSGTYTITVSKLGFVTETKMVTLTGTEIFGLQLQFETNKLETIIIKSRPKIMRVKADTIQYNIKNIIDGTERKAEDIIKKLPGLQVDEA